MRLSAFWCFWQNLEAAADTCKIDVWLLQGRDGVSCSLLQADSLIAANSPLNLIPQVTVLFSVIPFETKMEEADGQK